MIDLAEAKKAHPSHLMIVCHLATDDCAGDRLHEALHHHRISNSVPVLFLLDGRRDALVATAVQLGADDIVDDEADEETLRQAVRDVRRKVRLQRRPSHTADASANGDLHRAGGALTSVFSAAQAGSRISRAQLADGADALVAMVRRKKIRDWISAVRTHDNATYQHCLLVAGLVATFGMSLSLTLTQQHALAQAALLHDLGKVRVPLEILNKPGELAAGERRIIETHPVVGYDILVGQGFNDALCLDVVKHHHELLDGTGYPDRLSGSQISDKVRITTICDIFAAMIERRSYRAPFAPEQAYAQLQEFGAKLDQGLVKDFSAVTREM